MIQSLLMLVLALTLSMSLTSCGMGMEDMDMAGMDPPVNASGEPVQRSADDNSAWDTNGQNRNGESVARGRTAYDYLEDGTYQADKNGEVKDRGNGLGTDLTQGARDLLRDAGRAAGDAGRRVTDAAKDTLQGMKK